MSNSPATTQRNNYKPDDGLINDLNQINEDLSNFNNKQVNTSTDPGALYEMKEEAKNMAESIIEDEYKGTYDLFHIGRPSKFPPSVDPGDRIYKKLRSKMNVVDLIPCNYRMIMTKDGDKKGISGLSPKITFKNAIEQYRSQCESYGVNGYAGLRIYTTDDTTSMDTFTNEYSENFFQGTANNLSQKGQHLKQLLRSVNTNSDTILRDLAQGAKNMVGGAADAAISGLGLGDNETADQLGSIASDLSDVAIEAIATGKRISLPKVWSTSNYSPSLTCTVKLVSPYGSPKAIKEFIIRPLIHLLLLGMPKTRDGVSYGHPYPLTIKAYGLGFTPLGSISNISLRRGGGDTSFNLYRQPLTIEATLTFDYMNTGYGNFGEMNDGEGKLTFNPESSEFALSENIITGLSDLENELEKFPVMPTLGKIIRSLRPVDFEGLSAKTLSSSSFPTVSDINSTIANSVSKSANETTENIIQNTQLQNAVNPIDTNTNMVTDKLNSVHNQLNQTTQELSQNINNQINSIPPVPNYDNQVMNKLLNSQGSIKNRLNENINNMQSDISITNNTNDILDEGMSKAGSAKEKALSEIEQSLV